MATRKISLVFMGTPAFAVPSLKALVEAGYEVKAVFTQPDRPKGRGKKQEASDVKRAAVALGIPVYQPERIRRDGLSDLKALAPDLCVTAAFGQILSESVLAVPPLGTINVHASLLPKHRGSAPIAWGMLKGDTLFGITTMMTDRGIDTGDILLQRTTALEPDETCGALTERLSHLGASALLETLALLEMGTLTRIPQDNAAHTYDPMLKKEMGLIDWTHTGAEIICRIRALNPWPCAYTGTLKILNARESDIKQQAIPGSVLVADHKNGLIVQTGDGAIELTRIQAPGSKQMDARAYLLGHDIAVGETLR